jgi:hypothetical protein
MGERKAVIYPKISMHTKHARCYICAAQLPATGTHHTRFNL